MGKIPNVVRADELEWTEWHHGDHYQTWEKRLSAAMPPEKGHVGVVIQRIPPGKLTCPFHYHMEEDEFFLVLKGRALLRYGDETFEVREGDAISCPRGERKAHQFYNHTDEDLELLTIGENRPNEVAYYPDSDKWLIRPVGQLVGNDRKAYWDGEPDPPLLKK
jgi:uncharacterized cupin superfamily protein